MRGSIAARATRSSSSSTATQRPGSGDRSGTRATGRSEAESALAEMVSSVNRGVYVAKTTVTVAEYLTEWLASIEPTVRPATHYSYSRNVRLHVNPYLGSTPLVAVDAGMLNNLYAQLLATGRKNRAGGGLAQRSVAYMHTITHRAFRDAVKWGRLARDPADAADPPKISASGRPETRTWSPDELRTFLDGVSDDRNGMAYYLLAPPAYAAARLSGSAGGTSTSPAGAHRSVKR